MKALWLPLFFVACTSHHKGVLPPKTGPEAATFELKAGMSYSQTATQKGAEGKCVSYQGSKYCQWGVEPIAHFRGDLFEKFLPQTEGALSYKVTVNSLKSATVAPKIVQIVPGEASIKEEGIEWQRFAPTFESMLKASGHSMGPKPAQRVKVSFGLSDGAQNQVNRFLKVGSYHQAVDKKKMELWRVEVSSSGTSRDLKRIMPVLAAVAASYMVSPTEANHSRVVSENDLEVAAFIDFAGSMK